MCVHRRVEDYIYDMDQPPGPSNEPDALNSDSENVSNATDDQH